MNFKSKEVAWRTLFKKFKKIIYTKKNLCNINKSINARTETTQEFHWTVKNKFFCSIKILKSFQASINKPGQP